MLPGGCLSTVSSDPATAGSIALKNWFQSKPDDRYLALTYAWDDLLCPPGRSARVHHDRDV